MSIFTTCVLTNNNMHKINILEIIYVFHMSAYVGV